MNNFSLSPHFSSWCLCRPDPPGLSPSLGGTLRFSARRQHTGGSPHRRCLPPAASPTATPSAAAYHRPQTPAGTGLSVRLPHSDPPRAGGRQSSARLSQNCRILKSRSMRRRFSATCCGRRRPSYRCGSSSFLPWSRGQAALGASTPHRPAPASAPRPGEPA